MPPRNLDRLTRVYGPTTWDLYDRLDVSLDPVGPDQLHQLAGPLLPAGGSVLDVGCRDAAHLIRLVRENDVTGVGVEPVALHVARAREAVDAAGLAERIALHQGGVEDLPAADRFDLVWCRDVLTQVADLGGAVRAMAGLVRPGGRVLVHATFATDLLGADEAAMLDRHLGNVPGNLDRGRVEAAFVAAGLRTEQAVEVGTEWREHAEERTQPVSQALLRLARLRRRRAEVIADHGRDVYDHVEANLHWEVFQLLGKLAPVVHVLARD